MGGVYIIFAMSEKEDILSVKAVFMLMEIILIYFL